MSLLINKNSVSFQATKEKVRAFSAKVTKNLFVKPFQKLKERKVQAATARQNEQFEKELFALLQVEFVNFRTMQFLQSPEAGYLTPREIDSVIRTIKPIHSPAWVKDILK